MKQIIIEADNCNGCMTCTLACAAAHSESQTIVGAMLEDVPSRIQILPIENGKSVPMMCRHCEEPACVDACMAGAMQKDSVSGIVTNEGNEQSCVGCWMCIMACPYGAVRQHPEGKVALKCDGCQDREIPACVEACPERALRYEEVDKLSLERAEKAAIALVSKA